MRFSNKYFGFISGRYRKECTFEPVFTMAAVVLILVSAFTLSILQGCKLDVNDETGISSISSNENGNESGIMESSSEQTAEMSCSESDTVPTVTVTVNITTSETDTEIMTTTESETDTEIMVTTESETIAGNITTEESSLTEEELLKKRVDEIVGAMSLEQKIYQMFIVKPEALTGEETVTSVGEEMYECLKKQPVGGVVYFADNLKNREQTLKMLSNMQECAVKTEGVPIFLCVDEEGGRVARIGNNAGFSVPKVKAMQKTASEKEAYEAGNTIGRYLRELGFNLNFAPDADVLTNNKNSVIGDRSFGSDAQKVLLYAAAYSNGLHNNGILSTFKHFPGHGATEADTHEGFACTYKSYEELLKSELIPFKSAGGAGADLIMVSHISVPAVTGDNTPCSLSYKMVTEILRNDFGYSGLIITDAMDMGAIKENYTCEESTLLAVCAGVDIILMPGDLESAAKSILSAVNSKIISVERIDESVRRIIGVKVQMENQNKK